MANQPYEINPSTGEKAASNRHPTIANLPAVVVPSASSTRPVTNTHQCPTCGAWAPASTSVCTECGTRLQQKPQKVRCRVCSSTVSASLVICPHCGRELHAAPSRILSWGAPTVLVFLFLVIMMQRWESGNPLRWVQSQVESSRQWIAQAAQQLDPQITISTLPVTVAQSGIAGASSAPQSDTANPLVLNTDNTTTDQTGLGQTNGTGQESIGQANAATTLDNPAVGVANVVTATVEPATATVAALPTEPPTPTATTPAPTATTASTVPPTAPPTPTVVAATPTVAVRQPTNEAIVQAAPSASDSVSAASKVSAANAQTTTVTILQATATTIPSATVPPTPTPVPTLPAVTYTVRAGDTPLGIASRFDIGVDNLLAANGMSMEDARLLRVGQVLVVSTSVPAAATAAPSATPIPTLTPPVATTTPLPTATAAATTAPQAGMRVDAPTLRSPELGSFLSCGSANALTWLPVAYVRDSDQYLLHLGFLSGYNGDGSEQVTWILEQWRPANVTLWDLDQSLCGLAPQSYGRQWRWYVQVVEVDGTGWRPISPPSSIWGFSWN